MDIKMINEKLAAVLRENVAIDGPMTEDMSLRDDLDLDSLEGVHLAIRIEEEFGVHIDDDEVETWQSLGDVVASIAKKVAP